MGLMEIFSKQGGVELLKRYWHGGSLFTAVGEFLLLGKSRTALEILRLSTTLKTKQKLERKYRTKLNEFDKKWKDMEHQQSNIIWICWFQGLENAPELVKKCYYSMVDNLFNHKVILITSENMNNYVQFPDYIVSKWNEGKITHTHMTDLLRLELLIKYGGVWVDATVFCSEKEDKIPNYFLIQIYSFFSV